MPFPVKYLNLLEAVKLMSHKSLSLIHSLQDYVENLFSFVTDTHGSTRRRQLWVLG